MRLILMMIAAFFSVNVGTAQNDAKAKQILDELSAKTKTFQSMSADFQFSMINEAMDINETNEGTIEVKGQKYVVDLPELGVKVFSDGETIWNYMKDGNQVTITSVEDSDSELMDPSSIFSIYERGFRSEFVQETVEGGKAVYQLNLFPDTDEYQVTKIEVTIDKSTMMLAAAKLHATDDNIYAIRVKQMETNQSVPDSDFVFDASQYNDVEIIDFR